MRTRRLLIRFALGLGLMMALLGVVGGGPAPAAVAPVQPRVVQASAGDVIQVAHPGAFCPSLPPPTGNVIDVYPSQVGQLRSIVLNASAKWSP